MSIRKDVTREKGFQEKRKERKAIDFFDDLFSSILVCWCCYSGRRGKDALQRTTPERPEANDWNRFILNHILVTLTCSLTRIPSLLNIPFQYTAQLLSWLLFLAIVFVAAQSFYWDCSSEVFTLVSMQFFDGRSGMENVWMCGCSPSWHDVHVGFNSPLFEVSRWMKLHSGCDGMVGCWMWWPTNAASSPGWPWRLKGSPTRKLTSGREKESTSLSCLTFITVTTT